MRHVFCKIRSLKLSLTAYAILERCNGTANVKRIAEMVGISPTAAAKGITKLEKANFVATERVGTVPVQVVATITAFGLVELNLARWCLSDATRPAVRDMPAEGERDHNAVHGVREHWREVNAILRAMRKILAWQTWRSADSTIRDLLMEPKAVSSLIAHAHNPPPEVQ